MRREPRFVPRVVIEAIHLDQIREHGGLPGLRDEGTLEAALASPRQKWACDRDADLALPAASYGFALARSHPFADGNRRVAFLAMVVFAGLNGFDLAAGEPEVVTLMIAVARGDVDEAALADWLRGHLVEL